MRVLQIDYPGTEPLATSEGQKQLAIKLLSSLETSLVDMAISLSWFEQDAQTALVEDRKKPPLRDRVVADAAFRGDVRREYIASLNSPNDYERNHELHDTEIEKRIREIKIQTGLVPESYKWRYGHIHAHSFLDAASRFSKVLNVLEKEMGLNLLTGIQTRFDDAFPMLKDIRDSAQHHEDRIRGKRREEKIDLQPIDNNFVKASKFLATDVLNGNRLGYTIGNGSYVELEISETTLHFFKEIFEEVLSVFTWTGSPRVVPYFHI